MQISDTDADGHRPNEPKMVKDVRQPKRSTAACDCEQITCLLDKIARGNPVAINEIELSKLPLSKESAGN